MPVRTLRYLVVLVLLAAVPLVTVSGAAWGGDALPTPSRPIPASYFGMHIHRGIHAGRWPSVPFHGWRLWSAFCAWPELEPQRGDWDFGALDGYVSRAEQNGVEVMLLLGMSPAWASARPLEPSAFGVHGWAAEPANLEDWRTYVRTVATRYKGKIRYYELWNEPNLKGFYSGTAQQMLVLAREAYTILKQVDPSVVVVSPAATEGKNGPAWLDEYFALGGARYADVIAYHLYVSPEPPEAMVPLAARIRGVMKKHGVEKPLWNTETGWGKVKEFRHEEQAAYLARSFILNWAAGVERFYWYAWDNKDWAGVRMTDDSYRPTFVADAYAQVRQWLLGARMSSCRSDARGIWSCKLSRNGGYTAWIVWSADGDRQFSIPQSWGVRRSKDLSGGYRELPKSGSLLLGGSPLLLEK